MLLYDLVLELKRGVPKYTSYFNDQVAISSISESGGLVTVETATNHNLTTGDRVNIDGIQVEHTVSTLTQIDNVATAVLATDHDLTENWQSTVEILGADQSDYNGVKTFLTSPNRKTFTFSITGDPVSPATGTITFRETLADGYNGYHVVTVVNATTFTFNIVGSLVSDGIGSYVYTGFRITGSTSIERFMEFYTKQDLDDLWMCASLGPVIASKDRFTDSDGLYTAGRGVEFRQRLIEIVHVYIIRSVREDRTARATRDLCQHTIRNSIFKALLNKKFDMGADESSQYGLVFTGHDVYEYDRAIYVHEFNFEVSAEITQEDTVQNINNLVTKAYRDTEIDIQRTADEYIQAELNINQDDVPLD